MDLLVTSLGRTPRVRVADLEVGDWDRTLAVNLRAPFLLSRAVFPHMREAGRGLILNVSSVAGKKGWAGASAYCASKFGLAGFSQAQADEGRAHGIRASVLYLGTMATSWGAWSPKERREMERENAPPAQALPPGEVAAFIA